MGSDGKKKKKSKKINKRSENPTQKRTRRKPNTGEDLEEQGEGTDKEEETSEERKNWRGELTKLQTKIASIVLELTIETGDGKLHKKF